MCAVPNMAVFSSSLIACFHSRLLWHFLNDLEMVPVAPTITDITFVFTFHMHCFYYKVFIFYNIPRFFLVTFLSPITAVCISTRVLFLSSSLLSLSLSLLS